MSAPLDDIASYSAFVYSLNERHPFISGASLSLAPIGATLAKREGQVRCPGGIHLDVWELADFAARRIRAYSYEVYRVQLCRYDPKPQPIDETTRMPLAGVSTEFEEHEYYILFGGKRQRGPEILPETSIDGIVKVGGVHGNWANRFTFSGALHVTLYAGYHAGRLGVSQKMTSFRGGETTIEEPLTYILPTNGYFIVPLRAVDSNCAIVQVRPQNPRPKTPGQNPPKPQVTPKPQVGQSSTRACKCSTVLVRDSIFSNTAASLIGFIFCL